LIAKYVNVNQITQVFEGDVCDVLYSLDGKFYPAVVVKKVETGF